MCNSTSFRASVPQLVLYRRFARIRGVGLVGVLLAVTGCDGRVDSGHITAPLTPSAALAPGFTVPGAVAGQHLEAWLAREQQRIGQERERSRTQFAALKRQFDQGNHARPDSPLLWCAPTPYAAESRIIGPEGGKIRFGAHWLAIPAGALSEATVITAEVPVSTTASVTFSPHGLQFAKPAVLTLDYGHCSVPADASETAVYFDERYNVLEWPATTVSSGQATVQIWHFSRYGMASGRLAD